jgi:hypothetical protein
MENKIVLELIRKDIEELALLVDALKGEQELSKSWIDITLSKAQTLLNEFKLLEAANPSGSVIPQVISPVKNTEMPIEAKLEIKSEENLANILDKQSKPEQCVVNQDFSEKCDGEVIVETIEATVHVDEAENEKKTIIKEERPGHLVDGKTSALVESMTKKPSDTVVLENQLDDEVVSGQVEDSFQAKDKKVLGELFTKEPSLNEKLAMNKPLESKIKARPVTSIKSVIGINDKFLYMRELFANDSKTFEHAVNYLDQADNLVQAVEYLENNFQWQKTETSLKFLDLVKRRFEN